MQKLLNKFAVNCLYYQGRLSPELKQGVAKPESTSIHGFMYEAPVAQPLIRTAISYHIINTDWGRMYEGGARFTVMPTKMVNGQVENLIMYDRVFRGDVIVVLDKPIRDYDLLTKGRRDKLFAFDVLQILSVIAVNADQVEARYAYGTDYVLKLNGVALPASVNQDGTVTIKDKSDMPAISDLEIAWTTNGKHPAENLDYAVEFLCSPNYVVWDSMAKPRATAIGNLPKTILCAKRAFFNKTPNPIDSIPTRAAILDHHDELRDSILQGD